MAQKRFEDSGSVKLFIIYINLVFFFNAHSFQGYKKIENLEHYTGLKSLWLENNCISEICGLENQTELTSLYLHNNLIKKIENLDNLTKLDTINLCHNFITKIENLSEFFLVEKKQFQDYDV